MFFSMIQRTSCSVLQWKQEHLTLTNSHAQSHTLFYLNMTFVKYFLFSLHNNLSLFLKPETFYFQVYVVLIVFCPRCHVFPQNAAILVILSYLFYIQKCLRKDQNTLEQVDFLPVSLQFSLSQSNICFSSSERVSRYTKDIGIQIIISGSCLRESMCVYVPLYLIYFLWDHAV